MNDLIITCACGKHKASQKEAVDLMRFLEQSNAIEGVYDDDSLIQALEAWCYLEDKEELSHDIVLKTHKILMLHQKLKPNEKGYFRTQAVWVGGREGVPHFAISDYIGKWIKKMNAAYPQGGNEELSKHLHVEYEKIHPFIDGNGRTGRMFMNWWRLKNNLPLMIIHADRRHAYYEWFK